MRLMERFQHGGNIYEEAPPGKEWLDFSANINPLGLPQRAREAILRHVGDLIHYPDPQARELKAAISSRYGVPQEEILLGNGAAELLYLFFARMRFSRVLLPQPSFSDYERAALSAGSRAEYLFLEPERGFSLPLEEICRRIPSADCAVFCNPNNPTGNLLSREDLETSLEAAKGKTWILVDESFLDFCEDGENRTLRHLVKKYPRLFVLQSLTKFYALPGLRLGFGIASMEAVKGMEEAKDVWNVNLLAQKAGVEALGDEEYRQTTLQWLSEERAYMEAALGALPGMQVFRPSVNFVLVNVEKTGRNPWAILSAMKERGILLRNCGNYPSLNENYIRMAIRSHEDNLRLMAAWEEVLCEEGGGV